MFNYIKHVRYLDTL